GLPDSATVRRSVQRIGWQKVRLDPATHSVFLPEKGMRINLAGVLQGYGVRRAAETMKKMGIAGGLINGSGDVYCWGHQPDGSSWRIAIGDPAPTILLNVPLDSTTRLAANVGVDYYASALSDKIDQVMLAPSASDVRSHADFGLSRTLADKLTTVGAGAGVSPLTATRRWARPGCWARPWPRCCPACA
ncbi:FAD:protein FMN transferase, partial [Hymenobacter caeli]